MENGASTKAPMLTVPTVSSNMQTRTLSHKRLPCDTTGQKPNRLLFYLHIWKMKLGCSNSSQPNWSVPAFQHIIISNFTYTHRCTQRWANINNLNFSYKKYVLSYYRAFLRTHAHNACMHAYRHTQNGQNTRKQVANRYVKSENVRKYSKGGVPFLQHSLAE